MIVLITGPVRSGKSRRAACVAREFGTPVSYVATLRFDAQDREMADRIARHQRERGDADLVEVWQPGSLDLPAIIASTPAHRTLLVDSLGTWLAGHLLDLESLAERDAPAALVALEAISRPLVAVLATARCNIVLVAEETGWGLVPPTAQGRIFRDGLGRLTQEIGQQAQRVELVVAGFAVDLRRYGVSIFA